MITALLVFWPLIISLVIFLFQPSNARWYALTAAVLEFATSLVLLSTFDASGDTKIAYSLPWIASLGISFSLQADGISMLLLLLTSVLIPFIILASFNSNTNRPAGFYALILLMESALVGVFTAADGFLFYVFWEMALIPIYFICLLWGDEGRGRITFKFFVYTLAGSLVMLVALLYLYLQTPGSHSFDMQALYEAGRSLSPEKQGLVFWGLFLAFAIKIPVFPFHTWQPDTYTVAPMEGTMLLSGIMLKMGFYGILRWVLPVVPAGVSEWAFTVITLAVISVLYGSVIAINQKDFKRLVAYASIAHVGLIAAGLLTLQPLGIQGALIQMISHGILAFALFYICELITVRTGTRTITSLGGLRSNAPVLATVFIIVLLGTVALPFTSGFVGEFLLINALFQFNVVLGALAGLTIILGAVYMLRAFQFMMLGNNSAATEGVTDLNNLDKAVLYPIVVLVFVIGIHPDPLLKISDAATADIIQIFSTYTANLNP